MCFTLSPYFIFMEVDEVLRCGWREYLFNGWNYIEVGTSGLTLAGFFIQLRVMLLTPATSRGADMFTNSRDEAFTRLTIVMAISCGLMCCRLVKYISWIENFSVLGLTLAHAGKDVASFWILLSCFVLGFSLMTYFLFGQALPQYNTLVASCYTHLKALLGDFDYESIDKSDVMPSGLGPVIGLIYMIMSVFVLVITVVRLLLQPPFASGTHNTHTAS